MLNLTITSVPSRLITVTATTMAVARSPLAVSPMGTMVST